MTKNFRNQLKRSEDALEKLPLLAIIKPFFPTAKRIRKASKATDQAGADYLIELADCSTIGVDFKLRSTDPRKWRRNDLAVEIWSSIEHRIVGYRGTKTDYIITVYPNTGRAVLVPFRPFQRRVTEKRQMLIRALDQHTQATKGKAGNTYHSQHCFAPHWLFEDLVREAEFPSTPLFRKSA